MLRIRNKLDDARMALILSVADLYFDPVIVEDEMILATNTIIHPQRGTW
jgi:hypothetical protein